MAVLKDLIVHGPSRFLNGINTESMEANTIKASTGIFNQLIATTLEAKNAHIDELTANNATVFGVMDVKGKLQTNQWEAASIANVGGNFYISPTGKSSTGTVTITRTSAATSSAAAKYSVAMAGTFGVSSTSSTIWAAGAYGMATGNVSVGTKKYPLGTCDGPLSNISTGTNTITGFTISNIESAALDIIFDENPSLISSNAISSKPGSDLQVSVYLGKDGNNYMPIGILLTSYGKDNKQYIDIYDGTHSAGTSITGFADPVVRIGDLSGISPYTQSGGKYTITPQGWGIYTTQGYFRGEVYSEIGYIGGWTIDSSSIKTNNKASISDNTSGMRIDSANGIGFSGVTYFNNDGTGKVGPWSLSTTYLRNGNIGNATNTSVAGVYLGTDGLNISNGTAATTAYITKTAVNIGDKLTWNGSTLSVTGNITANTGQIGGSSGWTIVSQQISSGTLGYDNSMFLSTKNLSGTVSGKTFDSSNPAWRLTVGSNFGITNTGSLYASEAVISGAITANSLNVGSVSDPNHLIYNSTTNTIDLSTDWLKFDSSTQSVIIGKTNTSRAKINFQSWEMIDKNGNSYARVVDERNENGKALVQSIETGNGSYKYFTLDYSIDSIVSVLVDDVTLSTSEYTFDHVPSGLGRLILNSAPANGAEIVVNYYTTDSTVKTYTFGVRESGSVNGGMSFAQGQDVTASGRYSFAEGKGSIAKGNQSHAEGYYTQALWSECHAEGFRTIAGSMYSHAEGYWSEANGEASHAEGRYTNANGAYSHAEGYRTIANEWQSHAEGNNTKAYGLQSHAEGYYCEAHGSASHAGGCESIALGDHQTVIGKYNKATVEGSGTDEDPYRYFSVGDYAFIIGNGSGNTTPSRSNALTVDWNGVVSHYGDVTQSNIRSAITNLAVATNSGATIPTVSFTKKGNVAMLHMTIKSTGAIGGGSNIFQATLAAKYRPAQYTTGVGYYGNHPIIGRITADGAVLVRNVSTSNVTLTDSVEVAFTYILKDYFV